MEVMNLLVTMSEMTEEKLPLDRGNEGQFFGEFLANSFADSKAFIVSNSENCDEALETLNMETVLPESGRVSGLVLDEMYGTSNDEQVKAVHSLPEVESVAFTVGNKEQMGFAGVQGMEVSAEIFVPDRDAEVVTPGGPMTSNKDSAFYNSEFGLGNHREELNDGVGKYTIVDEASQSTLVEGKDDEDKALAGRGLFKDNNDEELLKASPPEFKEVSLDLADGSLPDIKIKAGSDTVPKAEVGANINNSGKNGMLVKGRTVVSNEATPVEAGREVVKNISEKMMGGVANIQSVEEGVGEALPVTVSEKTEKLQASGGQKQVTTSESEVGPLKNINPGVFHGDGDGGRKEKGNGDGAGSNLFISKSSGNEVGSLDSHESRSFKLSRMPVAEEHKGIERLELTRLAAKGQRAELKMELTPPSMGRLQVELNINEDQVRAVFHTSTQALKTVIEGNMQGLKDSLSGQELELESFDVLTQKESREKWSEARSSSDSREGEWEGIAADIEDIDGLNERISLSMDSEGLDIFV